MNQKTKAVHMAVIVLTVAFGFAAIGAVAKNSNAKSEKSGDSKNEKSLKLKDYQAPDKTKGQTNAQVHKAKTDEVVDSLEEVAKKEKSSGNAEVGDQVEQVIEEQEQIQAETTAAIEEVESRGKIKTFLVGTDYKNLGQLRSSLVHNRNQIRKLTQALIGTQTAENKAQIEAQLTTLMQERERIKTVITNNEGSFSLFGWVSRFLFNYEQKAINGQEEEALEDEVAEAVAMADGTAEATDATEASGTVEEGSGEAVPGSAGDQSAE